MENELILNSKSHKDYFEYELNNKRIYNFVKLFYIIDFKCRELFIL